MKKTKRQKNVNRRHFFKLLATGGLAASFAPLTLKNTYSQEGKQEGKPATNIKDALAYPRNENSLPGKFPGKVVHIHDEKSAIDDVINEEVVYEMIKTGMITLTGKKSLKKAWRMFVGPDDIIGLKVNPVAGKLLSTSLEVTSVIIKQLEESGIPRKNLVIWDRREFQLEEVGYTSENFPGINITGTEQKDKEGSFYDADGELYGKKMIDMDWYYFADVEGEYDSHTLPYMVNEGKYSYFSKICTKDVDKIINIPILKNAGGSVTLALKNIAYGAVSNTSRLHKDLWSETCAEVPAFPPLRDKVVLNIIDGIKGCFNGGPGANPQFFTWYKDILIATDPVAVDRIGYEIVIKKRIEKKIQKKENPKGRQFLEMAKDLKLGECDLEKIDLKKIELT